MRKILFTSALALGLSITVQAHDEGHGPKLSDSAKYGGVVASVVAKADAKKGAKAAMIHKAELVRSTDGTARVYLYDASMKPLDLKNFEAKAKATVGAKVKGKWKEVAFDLDLKENAYVGQMPKAEANPYSVDVTLKAGGKDLLTAFDNLD